MVLWNLHPLTMKLWKRKKGDGGGRTEEKKREQREKARKKESLVLWSEAACQRLPCQHFNDSSHVRNKLRRWWSSFHLLSLASLLPQRSWSAVRIRSERKKETEPQRRVKSKTFWSIIYFQSNAFTQLLKHRRIRGGLWSLFRLVKIFQSPPPYSYFPCMFICCSS